jgi:hypothetical protein
MQSVNITVMGVRKELKRRLRASKKSHISATADIMESRVTGGYQNLDIIPLFLLLRLRLRRPHLHHQ